jgi:hypothetical protein
MKAIASDLAVIASRLRLSIAAKRRRTRPPRAAEPSRISLGSSAGRVLWRLSIVLLGLGSICAGVLCALTLWVLFGFPLEARKSAADTAGLRAEAANGASIGRGAPKVAQASRPDFSGQPGAQVPARAESGSSTADAAEPAKAAGGMPAAAPAGADQPQLARTETQDRRPPTPAPGQEQPPAPPQQLISAAPSDSPATIRCNVDLCAARYKSFDAADCTYRPYGGGPRRTCEPSTRAADASLQTPAATAPVPDAKDTGSGGTPEKAVKSETPDRAGLRCNVALCAGRYKSFNAADCTYEPYGGGPRRICEMSGRSADTAAETPRAATDLQTEVTDRQVAAGAEDVATSATPLHAGSQCDRDVCGATYKSFNAADCTYQPHGGGPRRICELRAPSADTRPRASLGAADTGSEATDTRVPERAEEGSSTSTSTSARLGPQCNIGLCAATYRSFHAADCTYQPAAGGPRRICER